MNYENKEMQKIGWELDNLIREDSVSNTPVVDKHIQENGVISFKLARDLETQRNKAYWMLKHNERIQEEILREKKELLDCISELKLKLKLKLKPIKTKIKPNRIDLHQ